ncbi:POTE ankyrin domain family member A-like [Mus caroli]|uniref:POTE ankyrin domain family member A-like n=1 Tax=Mus caroli TaxID=10089 RepID=A0A6P5PG72_MUSCR|nr:POTE ankyrin domain family member A-like [Mus caroli]
MTHLDLGNIRYKTFGSQGILFIHSVDEALAVGTAMAVFLSVYYTTIQDNLTPLLLALRENRLKMAQFLVRMEASVHAVDSQRRNSLMYAVRCDSPVMVNLILQQGVDTNLKDLFGWTALRYATEGDRDVRTILLELRKRNRAFQSSENSSIRLINKADAEVTSPTANEVRNVGPGETYSLLNLGFNTHFLLRI